MIYKNYAFLLAFRAVWSRIPKFCHGNHFFRFKCLNFHDSVTQSNNACLIWQRGFWYYRAGICI